MRSHGSFRHPLFIPGNDSLVEVTVPYPPEPASPDAYPPLLSRIIIGALARAGRRYEVGVVAFSFLANHYHLLLQVQDADQLASFMTLFNSKLAREVARLTGWKDKIWSRRYQAIVISNEEAAQVARLFYVLSNGVKENLVPRVSEWPGVHAAPALLAGTALEGSGSTGRKNTWRSSEARCIGRRIRGARDTHPGALALLEASLLRAVPPSNREHGPED